MGENGEGAGFPGGGIWTKLRKFRNIAYYFPIEIEQSGGNHYEKGGTRE